MIENYRRKAAAMDGAGTEISSGLTEIARRTTDGQLRENDWLDRPVAPTDWAIPGSDAARAILVLAAETAFELQDGTRGGAFAVQLAEALNDLEYSLKMAPNVSKGIDRGLMLRRAWRAVEIMKDKIRREVLGKIDENSGIDEVEAALHVVKNAAVEAGKELKLLETMNSRV